jgi:hypothetical protein
MSKTSVLIFVQSPSHFAEMFRVAQLLDASPRYRPVVFFAALYEGARHDAARCEGLGIEVLTADGPWKQGAAPAAGPVPAPAALPDHLVRRLKAAIYAFAIHLLRLARGDAWPLRALRALGWALVAPFVARFGPALRRGAVRAFGLVYRRAPFALPPDIRAQRIFADLLPGFLGEHGIRLAVLPEDNFFYATNLLVRAIHERGGAAVIVPFTIANRLEWSEAFLREPACDAALLANRIVAALFPAWAHTHRGKRMVLPIQFVLATEFLGTAPPVPWLINSGRADALAAESPFMADYYRRAGLPGRQIRVTGALYDDVLYRGLREAPRHREALYRELGLTPGRPMILCAMPPNQLRGGGRSQCAFRDYGGVLEAFLAALDGLADDHNVIINPHPRITAQEARAFEGRRARVSRRDIADLVPLARIFVASCSATIRLAMACAIPVVNYDVYAYDYDDYTDVPGVLTVGEEAAYAATLGRLARDAREYDRVQALQRRFAEERTILDGRAGERLLALFDEVLSARGSP